MEQVRELAGFLADWDVSKEEVICIQLYTGPMFEKYNKVLRTLPDPPQYPTTILVGLHLDSPSLVALHAERFQSVSAKNL